ncbi:cation:proton antiporter [Arcobacter sp. HD9-500m-PIT-SAG03]|nr:cation:proton antiporter [Arcobacter sp. HD9-500m-PIT-SAG03]
MEHSSSDISIIITISLIIFASPLISKLIRIPTVPVEIILGALAVYFSFIVEHETFTIVAEVGFLYLMFLAGLEVDLKRLVNISPSVLKRSLLYLAVIYSLSILITLTNDLSKIFIVILPLISIGLIASLKKEYGNKDWIKLSITVGLIGEIISIIVLTTASAAFKFKDDYSQFSTAMMYFFLFLVSIVIIYKLFHNLIWWYPEIKTYLMPKIDNQEQDIRLSMAIFFLMIAVMIQLKLEIALGGFLAGTFIITFFEHNKQLPRKLEHFGFGWLVPIFFISVGTKFDLSKLFSEGLIEKALLIAGAMILIRVIGASLFVRDLGHQKALLLGLSHSMPLTLLIAVATLAFHNNSIDEFYYLAFVLASILEVITVMIAIRGLNHIFVKFNSH